MSTRLLRMLGRQPWVQDVVQDAYESYLAKRHTFRAEGSVDSFVTSIAMNAARDVMRRQRRTAILDDLFRKSPGWPTLPACPDARAEDRDRVRRLLAVLERIGPAYRIPYLLYHVEGMSVDEIAASEGISTAAVRKRISRARERIRARAGRDPVLAEWLEERERSE